MNKQTNAVLSQLVAQLEAKGMKCSECGCPLSKSEAVMAKDGEMLCEGCAAGMSEGKQAKMSDAEYQDRYGHPRPRMQVMSGGTTKTKTNWGKIDKMKRAGTFQKPQEHVDYDYDFDASLDEEKGPVVARVPSESNPEKEYEIRLGKDGNFYCSCPNWKNMKKPVKERVCKHIKTWAAAHDMKLPEGSVIELGGDEIMVLEMATETVAVMQDALREMNESEDSLDEGGAKFKKLVKSLSARGDIEDPKALAAWIGRKKYGAKKFAKMAAAGRKD